MNKNVTPRINVAISAHGYGHLTQVCAVLQALKVSMCFQLRIQCGYDRRIVRERLGFDDFEYDQYPMDVALVQHDPLQPDLKASHEAYRGFHHSFSEEVDRQAKALSIWQADLVISDISYLAIAAASEAGIRSVAIASLSWDHIVSAYFDSRDREVHGWTQQICQAYSRCGLSLLPEPAMQPNCFPHSRSIPPLMVKGQALKQLRESLGIESEDPRPLVFCSLGGIAKANLPVPAMALDERFHWIVNVVPQSAPAHVHFFHESMDWWQPGWSIHDLLASVDAIVSKPGYGMAVEAVAHGLPFVFTQRGHFPDEPPIIDWLHQNGRVHELSQENWFKGRFGDAINELLKQPAPAAPECNGANVAADIIRELLSGPLTANSDGLQSGPGAG